MQMTQHCMCRTSFDLEILSSELAAFVHQLKSNNNTLCSCGLRRNIHLTLKHKLYCRQSHVLLLS